MNRPIVSAALSLALACANPASPHGGQLTVQATPPVLELTNQSAGPVYYFTIERGAAAYTDWAPCTDPVHCTGIKPGQSATVGYAVIVGYTVDAREAIVYWWHLVPGGTTGFRPDSLRAIIVGL